MTIYSEDPATGIYLIGKGKDWSQSYVACDCGDPDHQIFIHINKDYGDVEVEFTTFIEKRSFVDRIKTAWHIMLHGRYEINNVIALNPQAAINFSDFIIKEVNRVKEYK